LTERLHFLPVAEEHDVDEQRQLPPELQIEGSELCCGARGERHDDRERDEEHHPRLPVAKLPNTPTQERGSPVEDDDGAEDRRDTLGARELRGGVAEPLLHHLRPEQNRNAQQDAQPEPVAKHLDAVSRVLVVGAMLPGRLLTRLTGCVIGVCHLVDTLARNARLSMTGILWCLATVIVIQVPIPAV
jgi:hypothetical protein